MPGKGIAIIGVIIGWILNIISIILIALTSGTEVSFAIVIVFEITLIVDLILLIGLFILILAAARSS